MPPPSGAEDPRGVRAGADKDYHDDNGIVEDFVHLGGALWRAATWPLRFLAGLVRR
jgi:hypothetical protein